MTYTSGSRSTCPHARTFIQIAEQTIFSKISEHTRPDQFTAAEEILQQLCHRLESQVDMFHYPAATGDAGASGMSMTMRSWRLPGLPPCTSRQYRNRPDNS